MARTKDPTQWVKSSFTDGVQCAEVRLDPETGQVNLRDDADYAAVTTMSRGSFDAFRKGMKAGEFDHI